LLSSPGDGGGRVAVRADVRQALLHDFRFHVDKHAPGEERVGTAIAFDLVVSDVHSGGTLMYVPRGKVPEQGAPRLLVAQARGAAACPRQVGEEGVVQYAPELVAALAQLDRDARARHLILYTSVLYSTTVRD
jgi:hypothetical protein